MMVRSAITLVLLVGLLSGCATVRESRFNPFNWFGSDEESLSPIDVENERRPLVAEITSLVVERTPGGAIVRANSFGRAPEASNAVTTNLRFVWWFVMVLLSYDGLTHQSSLNGWPS